LAISLEWEPQFAGIAASGDLGFTTGPSIRWNKRDSSGTRHHGQFFSVWRKQKDGTWGVAVDIGTSLPSPASPLGKSCEESQVLSPTNDGRFFTGKALVEMNDLENAFTEECRTLGVVPAYLSRATEETRLHRENQLPLIGLEAIKAYVGTTSLPMWIPAGSGVSASKDLGYTYGRYEMRLHSADMATVGKGYYLHVWCRTKEGIWKLVADITTPSEEKE
jgi:ketosteroid isomerase-like protein